MDEKAEKLQWVMRFQRGEEEAFSWLFEAYYTEAFRMAWLISGNYADSEDIVQEAFTACYYHRGQLKNPEGFRSWFYKIVTRTAWRQCRKKRRESPQDLIPQLCEDRESGEDTKPLEAVMQKMQDERIYQAVAALPIKQRTVVVLYYFNELSTKEIAHITGSMEGTVKSRLHAARKNLRESLKSEMLYLECQKESTESAEHAGQETAGFLGEPEPNQERNREKSKAPEKFWKERGNQA